jgi:hypothetical protein
MDAKLHMGFANGKPVTLIKVRRRGQEFYVPLTLELEVSLCRRCVPLEEAGDVEAVEWEVWRAALQCLGFMFHE